MKGNGAFPNVMPLLWTFYGKYPYEVICVIFFFWKPNKYFLFRWICGTGNVFIVISVNDLHKSSLASLSYLAGSLGHDDL